MEEASTEHISPLMFWRDSADGSTAVIGSVAAKWGSLSRWGGKRYSRMLEDETLP